MNNALGLVEAIGRAAAIVAVDTILKAANVTLIGIEPSKGGGMYAIKIEGDVGAVKAAVDSIKSLDELQNKIYTSKVIPRPAAGIEKLVYNSVTIGYQEKVKAAINEVVQAEEKAETANIETVEAQASEAMTETVEEISEAVTETVEEQVAEAVNVTAEEHAVTLETAGIKIPEAVLEVVQDDIKDTPKEVKKEASIKGVNSETKSIKKEGCNLCNDPKCKRKRGEPKNLCIKYNPKST